MQNVERPPAATEGRGGLATGNELERRTDSTADIPSQSRSYLPIIGHRSTPPCIPVSSSVSLEAAQLRGNFIVSRETMGAAA